VQSLFSSQQSTLFLVHLFRGCRFFAVVIRVNAEDLC